MPDKHQYVSAPARATLVAMEDMREAYIPAQKALKRFNKLNKIFEACVQEVKDKHKVLKKEDPETYNYLAKTMPESTKKLLGVEETK